MLLLVLIVSQCGCSGKQEVISGQDWLLDTSCSIVLYKGGSAQTIDKAFSLGRDYEALLSRTMEGSDVWNFNHSETGCTVGSDLFVLTMEAVQYAMATDGLFDPTVGSVSSLWDFGAAEPALPDAQALEEGLTCTGSYGALGFRPVAAEDAPARISPELINAEMFQGVRYFISKPDPGVMLDMGAIAKGYIADRLADFLRAEGIKSAIISLGGNIVLVGDKPGNSPWIIGIQDPGYKEYEGSGDRSILGSLELGEGSVVTSGTYERCFDLQGQTYHHVLDPRTGYPAETDLDSATVIGPQSICCDALSTCCLLSGSQKALELIERYEGYECVLVKTDGTLLQSSGADLKPAK